MSCFLSTAAAKGNLFRGQSAGEASLFLLSDLLLSKILFGTNPTLCNQFLTVGDSGQLQLLSSRLQQRIYGNTALESHVAYVLEPRELLCIFGAFHTPRVVHQQR